VTNPQEPNEFGFAGGGTAPQPQPEDRDDSTGERIAVPADDLTNAFSGGVGDATVDDDESADNR
jgi:hypothetical protein